MCVAAVPLKRECQRLTLLQGWWVRRRRWRGELPRETGRAGDVRIDCRQIEKSPTEASHFQPQYRRPAPIRPVGTLLDKLLLFGQRPRPFGSSIGSRDRRLADSASCNVHGGLIGTGKRIQFCTRHRQAWSQLRDGVR